jgi:hypothetical protein
MLSIPGLAALTRSHIRRDDSKMVANEPRSHVTTPRPGSVEEAQPPPADHWAPYAVASRVHDYYKERQNVSRRWSRTSEVILLALTAAVTISGVLNPDDSRIPSILGALAVVVAGLRSTFHWRDDWIRFGLARMSLRWELRRYDNDMPPYADAQGNALDQARKDRILIERLNEIEMRDSSTWASMDKGTEVQPAS